MTAPGRKFLLASRGFRFTDATVAMQLAAQGVRLGQNIGCKDTVAMMVEQRAQLERDAGRVEQALASYEEAVALFEEKRRWLRAAHARRHVAALQVTLGRAAEGMRSIDAVLRLYAQKSVGGLEMANTLRVGALAAGASGDDVRARAMWGAARDLYRAAGVEAGVAEAEKHLA